MIALRSVKPWRLCNRRLCAGIALFSYLTTIFGFPLPAATRQESKACGCPIAGPEVACCCTTGQSGAVVDEAVGEEPTPPPTPTHPCCANRTPEPKAPPKARAVSQEPKEPSNPAAGLRWVLGIAALRCQGQATLWINSGAVTVPPPVNLDCAALDCVGTLPDLQSRVSRVSVPPLDPPPRGL
jgi:hypothetical protein